jgi:DNA-binding beta-propeller fold protein YncE
MKAFVCIPVVLAALLVLLAAPASTRAALPRRDRSAADHDLLVLRADNPAFGSLFALPASGHALRWLPLGLFDRDGRTLYVAHPRGVGRSVVQAIDVPSGRLLRSMTVAGSFSTATDDYSAATLSFNGRWLALRAATAAAGSTRAIVVDTAAMRVVATLRLAGHFGLDAVDPDGKVLYLIEHLVGHGPVAYRVRSYELRKGVLDVHPVFEKSDTSGTMSGVARTRAWSPDGDWLYTLYVHPGRAGAFIHALGVKYQIAQCINLPNVGATATRLAHFTLAVAHDGTALYAVNPVLGLAVAVRGSPNALPFSTPQQVALGTRAGSPQRMLNGSAVSGDGRTLFVATSRGVWVIDSESLAVRTTYLAGRSVASVALSRDGRRLYALESVHGVVNAVDLASGRILYGIPTNTGAWAIEQVTRLVASDW